MPDTRALGAGVSSRHRSFNRTTILIDERVVLMTLPHVRRGAITTIVALLLVFGSFSGGAILSGVSAQQQEPMTKVEVVDEVGDAVVTVWNITTGPTLFGQTAQNEPQVQGAGTGFIISEEGYVVTNWHVVEGGDAFAVILSDGTQVDAELIGEDPRDDLAVVKIDPASVTDVVSFGDSDAIKPGEEVLAIGSPLGLFSNTVTAGIVSGVGRNQLEAQGATVCQDYSNLIQHDAAINSGNSGGPLFNLQGEVIGVNTLGISEQSSGQSVQGIFFAIPSNTVQDVVTQLIETGSITRGYLGVQYYELSPQFATQYDLPVEYGALISEVDAGSPADDAGLQQNDIVVAVNGTDVSDAQSFNGMMNDIGPNEQVTLTVLRDGATQDIQVTLGEVTIDFSECYLPEQVP
jgi:S1-C subfamily serine protease